MKKKLFLTVLILWGMMRFSAYSQTDTLETVTIPKIEYTVLQKASLDLLKCEGVLGITNKQIEKLQGQIASYKQKEINHLQLEANWQQQTYIYHKELKTKDTIISQQKKVIRKTKITAWVAPTGMALVLGGVLIPVLLVK